jgi:hypothetical protein
MKVKDEKVKIQQAEKEALPSYQATYRNYE